MVRLLASEDDLDDLRESVDPRLMAAMYGSALVETGLTPRLTEQDPVEAWGGAEFRYAHSSGLTHELAVFSYQRNEDNFLTWDTGLATVTADPVLSEWIQQLDTLCQMAGEQNWDGEGAQPVQAGARKHAIMLVGALPTGTPVPACSIDPDGELSLSWQGLDDYVFSVSVSGTGRLSYAGLFGDSDCYGTAWLAETVPAEITTHLDRLLSARIADSQSG